MPPLVSVLVDTYNHEKFIAQAIASVLEQDVSAADVEVVVVDDGSTDATPEIVRKFVPRVRYIRKSNGGQASAFNAGIPECRGEIIAFLDGDDWWAPGKLQQVIEPMMRDSAIGIVGNGITEVFDNGDHHSEVLNAVPRFRLNSLEGARIFRRRKSQMGTSRMTVRSRILRQILPIPEAIFIEADEYIFTLASALSDTLILPEALTFYRQHAGNLYQISVANQNSQRRKERSLQALISALSEKLPNAGLPQKTVEVVLEPVRAEADQLRLQLDGGFPWTTVHTEWTLYRIVFEDAPLTHRIFKRAALVPALFCPPKLYYRLRGKLANNAFYFRLRQFLFPIPQPQHVTRSQRRGS